MSILMKGIIKMKYDDKFNAIYEVMSEIEGGYSNSSIDLGGETNYGITHTTFDNWNRLKKRPMRDIKSLTHEEAKEILYEMYYKASGADKLDDWRDSLVLFVMLYNMVMLMQEECLNKQETIFIKCIKIDLIYMNKE